MDWPKDYKVGGPLTTLTLGPLATAVKFHDTTANVTTPGNCMMGNIDLVIGIALIAPNKNTSLD